MKPAIDEDVPRSRVVIAHDDNAIRETAMEVARHAGYEVIGVADGESARILLASRPPPAVVVADVALPRVMGYELCDAALRHEAGTRIVLIASVYSKTAYKRRPTSLYGAYDYIEQHHIVDQLEDVLARAVADARASRGRRDPTPRPMGEVARREAETIRAAGEARLAFRYDDRAQGVERARRLARLVVADVLLYCGDEVEAWLAAGAGEPLPERLADDLDEGRRLFELRVPREIAAEADFIGEALSEFARSRA